MSTYISALAIAVIFLAGHLLGLEYNLYTVWGPYDIFMHLWGGLTIGTFLHLFLKKAAYGETNRRVLISIGVIVAGIIWELFEAYYGIAGYPVGTKLYYIDTLKDIIDDAVGGFVVAMLWRL